MKANENELNKVMSDLGTIRKEIGRLDSLNKTIDKEVDKIGNQIEHRIEVCEQTPEILDKAEIEFNQLTSILNKKDIPFFVFSILLQCGIQYIIKTFRDMTDKEIAKRTPFHNNERSNRFENKYYTSKEEIFSNPVPFDAIQKEHNSKWYKINNTENPGFNGFNHRVTALGHDPLLGLIFGTANIMTSTITRNDFTSWHINTMPHLRTSRNGTEYFAYLDTICERASTVEIFTHIIDRLEKEGKDGWIALGYALLKEIIHLLSDIPSRQSLPLPLISTFDPKLAEKLSLYGLNTGTIIQGGIAKKVINWLIAFLHGLTRGENEDEKLFMARTQKIIMYSDLFSTVSDIGYSMFIAYMGDKNAMRKFDLGGYIVTLFQISHSFNVISEIEREFYTKKIIDKFNQENYE